MTNAKENSRERKRDVRRARAQSRDQSSLGVKQLRSESRRSDLCQLLKEIRRQDRLDLVRQILDRHAEPVEKEMRDVGRDFGILMSEESEHRCA